MTPTTRDEIWSEKSQRGSLYIEGMAIFCQQRRNYFGKYLPTSDSQRTVTRVNIQRSRQHLWKW